MQRSAAVEREEADFDAAISSGIRLAEGHPPRPARHPLNWTPSGLRAFSRRELAAVVVLSALAHAGAAAAAYQHRGEATPAKRVSKVEIELARPPQIPKPIQNTPPPPPPPPKGVPKQAKAAAVPPPPEIPQPGAATQPLEQPGDTGRSSPSDADGELFKGSGGLGTAAPAPPPPPAPVAPVAAPVIQATEGANYAKNPRPAYPGRAKREGWQGTTLLRVQVLPSGRPGSVKVQRSSGRDVLDEAALEAVHKWMFVPASQGGNAVAGYVTVPIVFRLQ